MRKSIKYSKTKDPIRCRKNCKVLSRQHCGGYRTGLWILLLAGTMLLSACGGTSSPAGDVQQGATLSGNWQFTVENPPDNSFLGGLQGGFLLQKNGSITGGVVYSVSLPSENGGNAIVCNSGSAAVTGTVSGTSVTLTAVAGTQKFTLSGMLGTDGTTMAGTFGTTAGTAADGTTCGTAQTGLQWSAISVPPLTGTIAGTFHSQGGNSGLNDQAFPVTGTFTQGPNIGASNATVTGSVSFIDPVSLVSDYPCFDIAFVNGQISGSSVVLQLIGADGSNLGQIGGSASSGVGSVTFKSATPSGSYILQSAAPPAYAVVSKACPGGGVLSSPGDAGNVCLALNNPSACQEPITLSPAFLAFPTQMLGSTPTTQTITLTNNSPAGSPPNAVTLQLSETEGYFTGQSDFTGQPNFTEADNCAAQPLAPGQFCTITVTYNPQESCTWIPYASAPLQVSPSHCPIPLTARLLVNSTASADNDKVFAVPITATGASAIVPSTPEIDFGAEALTEASLPQSLTFTNQSANSVQILGSSSSCTSPLPQPLQNNGQVSGLQLVGSPPAVLNPILPDVNTIIYNCDIDPKTNIPNFQISLDTCTGAILEPQAKCSLEIAYVPQPGTPNSNGLDDFLELNTVQCWPIGTLPSPSNPCEIDSGRFPVEVKANPPSPLRMSPGAGLDFGNEAVGKATVPQTVTLTNDPAATTTVNFISKVSVSGNYTEGDDCPFSLAPGSSCTLTVTFKPKSVGFNQGSLTIVYTLGTAGTIGNPQTVYLRGTGQ